MGERANGVPSEGRKAPGRVRIVGTSCQLVPCEATTYGGQAGSLSLRCVPAWRIRDSCLRALEEPQDAEALRPRYSPAEHNDPNRKEDQTGDAEAQELPPDIAEGDSPES